ncbi:unnamed protein product, partial [Didymodactylos carnosus]
MMRTKQLIKESIKNHNLVATADLWSDGYIKRTYLNFIVFWLDESWNLRHSLLRCKHFTEDIKSGANIWQEIESIHMEF